MRVLRSRRSLPETPLKTLTLPPEPLTPSITDSSPNSSAAASSFSSSSVVSNSYRRLSLQLANISSPVTVSTDDGASKRKRSSRVSDASCYSDSREEPCLQLRSGVRISRRSLGDTFDLVKKQEEEMMLSFKEGGSGDGAEEKLEIMRGEAEVWFKTAESPPVLESIRDEGLVTDAEEKESKKKREVHHNSAQEGGYMSLRSGSRISKRKSEDESAGSLLASEDVDRFACRKVKWKEGVFPDWKCIEKSGDQMLINVGGIVPEFGSRGRNCEEKKVQDELVIVEDGLDVGMTRACFGTDGIDEEGPVQHFSNDDELVDRNETKTFGEHDKGVDASNPMMMLSSITLDSVINPIPEKGLPKEMPSFDGLVHQMRSRRYSREEKGKEKLAYKKSEDIDGEQISAEEVQFSNVNRLRKKRTASSKRKPISKDKKEADRKLAIELAPQFAFYKAEEESSDEEAEAVDSLTDANEEEDWPGPYSTALKIIQERESMLRARSLNSSLQKDRKAEVRIPWTPTREQRPVNLGKLAPSLKDLCLNILFENAEEIESLEGLPDAIKHKFALLLCRSRKMSSRILGLLAKGSPSEIYLSECSWATEREFEEVFSQCNICSLKVLQLDFCGRSLPDYVLHSTLAKAPNCLPSLNRLSLKGAYCISDVGLEAIVASAPLLRSLNLSHCSLITARGIIALADKLEQVLQELYLDNCQSVDAMLILPALKKLKCLEVLSVAHMETVTDKFMKKLMPTSCPKMRELNFAGCRKLTNASMETIGEKCTHLSSLDIRYLNRLNDYAIQHLANGGCPFKKLKFCHGAFSDEAIAAFLEASGATLVELVLNNIEKVAGNTALAISRKCSLTLRSLDLSFCRKLTDEALGLIVDSCLNLKILKLFGCTQVTNVFLEGHSNSLVTIIGLKGSILEQVEMPDFK